jgi:thiol:disulfide interchange protein
MKRVFGLVVLLALAAAYALSLPQFADGVGKAPAKKPSLYEKLLTDSSIFTLSLDKKVVLFPGKIFVAKVHVRHATGWHLYSSTMSPDAGPSPLTVEIPDAIAGNYSVVGIKEGGKMVSHFDSNFSAVTKAYYGDFDLNVSVRINKSLSVGSQPFSLVVRYMTCSETVCLPARSYAVPMTFLNQPPATLTLVETPKDSLTGSANPVDTSKRANDAPIDNTPNSQSAIVAAPPPSTGEGDIGHAPIWKFILAAAGFGLLALLTPCVYPMVPITISFFTKRNAGSKKEAVKDASLYAAGIIMTFVLIGFLMAALFGKDAINKFAASPWANMVIAGVFIMFALNLFGLFELGVPASVLTKLNSAAQSSKSRVFSVLMMGFVFSLASFTCTVPFVSTLMVTFSNGTFARPLIGMLVYATVFASPFFLLAIFPSLLKSMPRSGGWMNSVKVVMGFLELAAALKFLSNVDLVWHWGFFSRDLVLAAWIAVMVMTTIYLLGRFRMSHDTPLEHVGPIRAMIAVVFLSVAIYLYTGINSRPLGKIDAFLPPMEASMVPAAVAGQSGQTLVSTQSQQWFASYNDALGEAHRTGKNIFIDFTGYTCTNCRAMEATVFAKPEFQIIFHDFVLARLYTDDGSPLNDSNREMLDVRFHTFALPFYAIVSPDDKPLNTFPGYTPDGDSFKAFLNASRKSSAAVAMLAE